jgi:hypothetical protein
MISRSPSAQSLDSISENHLLRKIPKEDYNSKACRIYIGSGSLAGTSYARIYYGKAPSIPPHLLYHSFMSLCLLGRALSSGSEP